MSVTRYHRPTHLFIVRLWIEPDASNKNETRGRVQHVESSEVLYFRSWEVLMSFFETMLLKERSPPDQTSPESDLK